APLPRAPQIVPFDRKFVQLLGQSVANSASKTAVDSNIRPVVIHQARPNIRPKFAYNGIENKFNAEEAANKAKLEEDLRHSRVLQENRAKLYVSYLNSFVAKNQNPENIIKLYRPRFIHRKRTKKV